ncbi:MAG: hypothetical protein ABIS92_07170, partial [Polyangia bacterium]
MLQLAQVASMHDRLTPQSEDNRHCGAASPGVTHSPAWQTTAIPQRQQSAVDAHWLRQTAFTQT